MEHMPKRSHMRRFTPHEIRSSRIPTDHVVEPVAEHMQIERPEQDTKDSTTTFGTEFPSMGNGDQNIQATRKKHQLLIFPHIDSVFGDQQWKLGAL